MGYYLFYSKDTELCVKLIKHQVERVLKADVEGAYVGTPINTLESAATVHYERRV